MLEKLMNKQVKLLVGSNSGVGAGIATAGGMYKTIATSGIIIIAGVITGYDEDFVEIRNAETLYMNVSGEQPMHEKHKTMYINKKSIISISNDD